ncbi:DUF3027 domain-containing protein [Agromyces lapidis]|uniref:DUF3027 domain-containing protein n=1 Tax=Agromyces lapidis TaxID=279574 RepID=A0ABV5SNC3_9MICO|nr:DUF3027 domain-containing protein [Agromyces lapidis]
MPETPDTQQPAADESAAETGAALETAPPVADEALLASVDLARRALLEVTAPETVGSVIGHVVEGEHVLSLLFASDLAGYPGWRWSVTITRVDDAEPTVLETELMPGEQALLAPEWVPWSERLAEYRAAQQTAAELAAAAAAAGDDAETDEFDDETDEFDDETDEFDDEADDDSDEDDADDEDDPDDGLAHDDAFDGIDIDALDLDAASEDEDEDEDEDEATPTA